jgi:heptaprenylglyceryl phosphate synthase
MTSKYYITKVLNSNDQQFHQYQQNEQFKIVMSIIIEP